MSLDRYLRPRIANMFAEMILPEFDQEMATTRRMLERDIPVRAIYGPSADEAE